MSATMTLSVAPQLGETAHHLSCPNCGTELPADTSSQAALDAQRQIEDLQAQVRLLTQKATAAVDKWADYEDDLQTLRRQLASQDEARTSTPPNALQNRLSIFLSPRKSNPNPRLQQPLPSTPSERDLAAALSREQILRQQAEGKLDEASGELEELSQQLFEQANEMVATERKARAKLEERVAVLERRDVEKRKRLERLEGAMGRIERVRVLLAPGGK